MQPNFLNTMALKTKARLANQSVTMSELRDAVSIARKPHDFLTVFKAQQVPRIIAEIKFASPSLGRIATGDPVMVATQYISQGASAISILTEPEYFEGSLMYLKQVRDALPNALLLMKDFVLDEYQLLQARVYGADAVLLIVAFLEFNVLQSLYVTALELGLTPLIEVHTQDELRIAESIGARLIGVNNRNLQTLQVDLATSNQLVPLASKSTTLISESGIKLAADVIELQQQGYQGFLIGGQFMQHDNPGYALQLLIRDVLNER